MQRPDRYVSPAQLSRALGVGESTVKRWIDQGRIPAEKTPGGHRRIRLGEALQVIRSGLRAAASPDLLGFETPGEASPETLAALLCSEESEQAVTVLEGLYAAGVTACALSDRWIAPAMHRVGRGWETGTLPVTGEHRATAVMLRALHALLATQPAPRPDAPRALVAALAHDPYLIAPLCAQLVLVESGFAATNFGPDTPTESLVDTVREQRPALVAVSFSVPETTGARARAALGAACREAGAALVVGGRGLRGDLVDELGATFWCRSMAELSRVGRHLCAAAPRDGLARTG